MPINQPSQEYFHSWAAILSACYGHEDISPPRLLDQGANIGSIAQDSDLPIVLTYWPTSSDGGPQNSVASFRFGDLELNATGDFFADLEGYEPVLDSMRVNGEPIFESPQDVLTSSENYYTISYFYDPERQQIRFHLLFDPRTIAFVNEEETHGETVPGRQIMVRVEQIITALVRAHAPSWADERGELKAELGEGFFLQPDPRRLEREAREREERERLEQEEQERQEREREALITRLAAAYTHSRRDNLSRLEQQLENNLYEIDAARRTLRQQEERYIKTLQEIHTMQRQGVEDLQQSLRAYADSINLNNLRVHDRTIEYVVDRFKLYHNGQHEGFEYAEVGPFKIVLDRQTLALTVHATNGNTPETQTIRSRGNHIHPHVSGDGMVCWGGSAPDNNTPSGRALVAQIMRRRNMFELLFYAVDFFKRGYYSGDAYEQLSGWVQDPHQNEWFCDHCEEYHPNGEDCPQICQDCGEYVDWELHRHCPEHGCYDMETSMPDRDPANYESAHLEHCPTCVEEREAREAEERAERERREEEERAAEEERRQRELEIAAAEDAADAAAQASDNSDSDSDSDSDDDGGSVTLTPDGVDSEQEQETQEGEETGTQEASQEREQETSDIPF